MTKSLEFISVSILFFFLLVHSTNGYCFSENSWFPWDDGHIDPGFDGDDNYGKGKLIFLILVSLHFHNTFIIFQ